MSSASVAEGSKTDVPVQMDNDLLRRSPENAVRREHYAEDLMLTRAYRLALHNYIIRVIALRRNHI